MGCRTLRLKIKEKKVSFKRRELIKKKYEGFKGKKNRGHGRGKRQEGAR